MSVQALRPRRTPLDLLWQTAFAVGALAQTGPAARRLVTWVVFWPLLLALRAAEKTYSSAKATSR